MQTFLSPSHLELLQKRKNTWLEKNFHRRSSLQELQKDEKGHLILFSPTDLGVSRNGGRRGGQYAPQAIFAVLKKMILHSHTPQILQFLKVSDQQKEEEDFSLAQAYSGQLIFQAVDKVSPSTLFHLGGGHDHIYPLLIGMEKLGFKKIGVINIDAHCDTRIDDFPHSGTPFRHFAHNTKTDFHLIQLGVHNFANDPSTLVKIPHGQMTFLPYQEIQRETEFFQKSLLEFLERRISWEKDRVYILSLDCDAIDSTLMEGVSAVNHQGFTFNQICQIYHWYQSKVTLNSSAHFKGPQKILGIYEYNPLFDNLSQKGARALASLIYQVIHQDPWVPMKK